MKRYMLFLYFRHEGKGGFHDFINSFHTVDMAMAKAIEMSKDNLFCNWHIVNKNTGLIVMDDFQEEFGKEES